MSLEPHRDLWVHTACCSPGCGMALGFADLREVSRVRMPRSVEVLLVSCQHGDQATIPHLVGDFERTVTAPYLSHSPVSALHNHHNQISPWFMF